MSSTPFDSGDRFFHIPVHGDHGRDKLLDAVREHTAGTLEVFGEIGRGANGRIVYLARDIKGPSTLLLLRLDPGSEPNQFDLDRLKTLDSSVPSSGMKCPRAACGAVLPGWGRFCPMCAMDLGVTTDPQEGREPDELLEEIREFAHEEYDVLGSIPRTEGNGLVFFARDRRTGDITALRLEPTSRGSFQVGVTGILPRIARAADLQHPPPSATPPPKPVLTPRPKPEATRPVLQPLEASHRNEVSQRPVAKPPPRPIPGTMVGRPRPRASWLDSFPFLRRPELVIAVVAILVVLFVWALLT